MSGSEKDTISLGSSDDSAVHIHQAQRVRHLERLVSSFSGPSGLGDINFAEDTYLSNSTHRHRLTGRGFVMGMVTYSVPYSQWYKVQLDIGGPEIACCLLTPTAHRLGGVRENRQIPSGTLVFVYATESLKHGIILGCIPSANDGSPSYADWIVQGSCVGTYRESYYNSIADIFANAGDVVDFAIHSPVDSLSAGEWSILNDLGGGVFVDPEMSFMRTDESSGIWFFQMDRLARLSGYNYDFRSCASEEIIRNDDGEVFHYKAWAPYIWEALGSPKPNLEVHDAQENDKVLAEKELRAKLEPKEIDQLPIYRLEEFRGYAGQGYMRQLSLPDVDSDSLETISSKNSTKLNGLFREQLGLDGSWATMSAHSIHLVKRPLMPTAKLLRSPEDPEGDDLALKSSNYMPAGYYGTSEEDNQHKVLDAIPGPRSNSQWSAASLIDELAYTANWKGYHAFHYHLKDFANYGSGSGAEFSALEFDKLQKQQWLDLPDVSETKIDHRYSALLNKLASSLSLNNDGSISIRGGQGCEIRLAGGTATITAPGDILLQSGRSTINYAGDDAIIRANNSIDLSSSNNDVRVKAEKNLELMGGNGSTGRVLIEGKGTGGAFNLDVVGKQGEDLEEGGVIIKSAGDLVAYADEHQYYRTRYGTIVLDAAEGQQYVRINSHSVIAQLDTVGQFQMNFGSGEFPTVCGFNASRSYVGSAFSVKGILYGQDNATIRGSITAVGGENSRIKPGDPGFELADNLHTQEDERFAQTQNQVFNDYINNFSDVWYDEKAIGNSTIVSNVSFAPRSEAQMGTQDFKLPETYWQQLDVSSGNWSEPVIAYQGQDMMPHPGATRWATDKAFIKYTPRLLEQGREHLPGSDYSDIEAGELKEVTIQSEYSIYPRT